MRYKEQAMAKLEKAEMLIETVKKGLDNNTINVIDAYNIIVRSLNEIKLLKDILTMERQY